VIHLDTNVLIAMGDPDSKAAVACRTWLESGESLAMSALAWTEFCCGPLPASKLRAAEALLASIEAYLPADAELAARLFNRSGRRRGSMVDCMIAATAIRCRARLATHNAADFRPLVPHGLALAEPV
jgi:predicted nucleic acid-binding protein